MVTEYTPEEVAELIAEAREWPRDGVNEGPLINALADALEAVTANRDEFRTAWNAYGFEIIRLEAERDRLHKAITDALAFESVLPAIATEPRRILRAALDKGRNDDE